MAAAFKKLRIDRPIRVRSEGAFGLSSPKELAYLLSPRLLPMMVLLILPLVLPPYWIKVITVCCIFTLLALSWDLLHLVGMISLGQALFFGLGAYITGSLNHYFGLYPAFSIPVAALMGGFIGTLLLRPVLRLRGLYFAMITLAMASILVRVIEATDILGGTSGLSALNPLPNVWVEVYGAITAAMVCLFGLRRLVGSDYGMILRGIGENDRAVLSSGIDISRFKTQTLFIGATIGAFAGAYMTHIITSVGMAAFAMDNSVLPLAAVLVGGVGTFAGPMLGAFILVPLSEALRAFGELRIVFYCMILVIFIVMAPAGIFPFVCKRYTQTLRVVQSGDDNGK